METAPDGTGRTGDDLRVFGILREAGSLLAARLFTIVVLGSAVLFAILVLTGLLVGFEVVLGPPAPTDEGGLPMPEAGAPALIVLWLAQFLAYGLILGALTLLAWDAIAGRSRPMADHLRASLPFLLPIVVLTTVVSILIFLGLVLLVVPGLWVAAVFSVCVPAIVVEGAGFAGLARSAELTRGYRWPIVGLFVAVILIAVLFGIVFGIVLGVPVALVMGGGGELGPVATLYVVAIDAVSGAIGYGFAALVATILYARLLRIKDRAA